MALEEGQIYEECPSCKTSGVLVDKETNEVTICYLCTGDGYIRHVCKEKT